jgi:hypothetical protein
MNQSKDTQIHQEQIDETEEEEMRADQIEQEANVDVVGSHDTRSVRDTRDVPQPTRDTREEYAPLFENKRAEQFRNQWLEIQSRFVDDPTVSVKEADELVDQVIKNVTQMFAAERSSLETQWNSGDKVSTEDLRMALKRYRSFFDRLLSLEA